MNLKHQRVHVVLAALFAASCSFASGPAQASVQSVDGVWSKLPYNTFAPSARREHIAIYDASHNRYLMFGGFGFTSSAPENNFNEVWQLTLDGTPTWSLLAVAGSPPGPRKEPQWGYDVARQRLLIFGGYGQHYANSTVFWQDDVWQLTLDDNPTWTELFPSGVAPSARLGGVSVYDPLRQRFVGFGGTYGAPCNTWSLDLSKEPAWVNIPPGAVRPNGSYGMGAIYDPLRDRMLVFGGSTSDAYFGAQANLWELTLGDETPQWNLLASPNAATWDSTVTSYPKPRRSMTCVYDPMRDRMVMYGGFDALPRGVLSFLPDVWALPLSGDLELQWQQLLPEGVIPTGRDCTAGIYDPNGDRMVMYGGWSGAAMLDDTEYLTWGEVPKPAVIAGSATANTTSASMHWDIAEATGATSAVFRKTGSQPWTSIATVQAEATGDITFVDNDVVSGTHYSYELAVPSERGEAVGGMVSVTIPTTLGVAPQDDASFALEQVKPNPVVGRFNVSFTLPGSGEAKLDVIDVSGRIMFAQEVGSLGAGPHRISLGSAADLQPGMYFVRLSRADRSLTTRVVVAGGN